MADEVTVQTPSGGGNGFKFDLKNKALGITGPVVIPSLCILLVGAIGWLRSADFKESFASINAHIQRLYERQDTHRAELQALILTQFDQTRSQIRAQEERLHAQEKELIEMLRENRDITGTKLEVQNTLLEAQTAEVRRQHAIILYNMQHDPSDHLPIDLNPPPQPPQERYGPGR